MPQLSSSSSSVPLSYPLYLDVTNCPTQTETRPSYEPYNKPKQSKMIDLNVFYENLFNTQANLYPFSPQIFADSFNFYLNKAYKNGDKSSNTKSFSIESILGFQSPVVSNELYCNNFDVSPSIDYSCKGSSYGSESLQGSPTCIPMGASVFNSPIAANKDYPIKSEYCPDEKQPTSSNDKATNVNKTYPGISKKSTKSLKHTTKSVPSSLTSKSKRVRTIFTPEQLERLETEFERQQYMVGTGRLYLASTLNLTEAQVKVWFQNRRIKWRKQHLEGQQDCGSKQETEDCFEDAP